MTLQELLARHGIHRPIDLARRTGMTRQYAALLMSGQRVMSRAMADRIGKALGIPANDVLIAEVVKPPRAPRGRPRKEGGHA
jgi:transcriptional regulator with XRE-family HTH domain